MCPYYSVAIILCSIAVTSVSSAQSEDTLFAPDRLIKIEVKMDPDDWQALRISHRTPDAANWSTMAEKPYDYYRADVMIDGTEFKSVGVRKKGFIGSGISTRPSLKIKFDKYVKNRELDGMDMMTLNNNNQDPTQAQQFLVYSFMNRAGVMAPRCGLAHIVVNGENLGVYSHVDSIRKPFVKQHFGKANGDLYEGLSGDFTVRGMARIIHKWGKDDELEEFQKMGDAVRGPGPIDMENLEEFINVDAFIKFWAAEVFIGHRDGYAGNRNNWYLYRDPGSGRFHFIPWGADSAFKSTPSGGRYTLPQSVMVRGVLCRRLWQLPEIRIRYQAEMQRLLNEVWDEEFMLTELDRILSLTENYRTVTAEYLAEVEPRIREFIGLVAREQPMKEIRHHQERACLVQQRRVALSQCKELVERIDLEELHTGLGEHRFASGSLDDFFERAEILRIAVTERIADEFVVLVEQCVVDAPRIHADTRDIPLELLPGQT
jgi:spore coat protein H